MDRIYYRDADRQSRAAVTTDLLLDVEATDRDGLRTFLQERGLHFDDAATDAELRNRVGTFIRTQLPHDDAVAAIGIAPMNAKHADVRTTHGITIRRDGVPATDDFAFTPVLKRAPVALWGESATPDLNGNAAIKDTLAGFEIRPRTITQESETHAIDRGRLQYATSLAPTPVHNPAEAAFVTADEQGRSHIRTSITSPKTAEARGRLLEALGFDPIEAVTGLNPATVDEFWFVPVVGTWE